MECIDQMPPPITIDDVDTRVLRVDSGNRAILRVSASPVKAATIDTSIATTISDILWV